MNTDDYLDRLVELHYEGVKHTPRQQDEDPDALGDAMREEAE